MREEKGGNGLKRALKKGFLIRFFSDREVLGLKAQELPGF